MAPILIWIIVGIIAGWLAGLVMKGRGFGIVGDLIVGILGGILGGIIFRGLGLGVSGILGEIIVAFVGAVVLVAIVRTLRRV